MLKSSLIKSIERNCYRELPTFAWMNCIQSTNRSRDILDVVELITCLHFRGPLTLITLNRWHLPRPFWTATQDQGRMTELQHARTTVRAILDVTNSSRWRSGAQFTLDHSIFWTSSR